MPSALQNLRFSAINERAGRVLATPHPALTTTRRTRAMAEPKICSVEGCGKARHARCYCSTHLYRLKKHGCTAKPSTRSDLPLECGIDRCSAKPERGRKGMCARHYRMLYRRGTAIAAQALRGSPEAWLRQHVAHSGDACLTWPFCRSSDGAGRLGKKIDLGDGKKSAQAARVMCALAHGAPPSPTHQAAHKCGNGHHGCINPQHLEWKTPLANTRDKNRHGTMRRGEAHPSAKLTALQARAIRSLAPSFSLPELADLFGASPRSLSEIISGKAWRCPA